MRRRNPSSGPPPSKRSRPPPSGERGPASIPPPPFDPNDPLGAAILAALDAPADEERWDRAEALAADTQKPELVADGYARALRNDLPAAVSVRLGERAVRFHDEWFEDASPLADVLGRVLDADASAQWAFDRLVMLHTNASRWDDLLALYDRALAVEQDKSRRTKLLDEAAHVAKDFANKPDRAIDYMLAILPLRPTDAQLATSLERLLEKQKRHRDLIDLWTARVAVLPRDGKLALRARIAQVWLEKIGDAGEALAVVEGLLADDPHDTYVLRLLEKIVGVKDAPEPVRRRSLRLLKERYAAANRGNDVVRVLELALESDDVAEKIAVHREIVERLEALSREADAIEHAAALVKLDPSSTSDRDRLRALAEKTGAWARLADALTAAADVATDAAVQLPLLVEAAAARVDRTNDVPTAIALYARALAGGPEGESEVLLDVARRLSVLLEREGRSLEQLDVLERLASLEPEAAARREVLGRAANIAEARGDLDRALANWRRRIAGSIEGNEAFEDVLAIDATIDLLDRMERWEEAIEALRRRAEMRVTPEERRTHLVRIARIQSERAHAVDDAIATWRAIEGELGPDAETIDALSALYAIAKRWSDLAALLETAASHTDDPRRRAILLRRLGDVHRAELKSIATAVERYCAAVALAPADEGARAGLQAIVDDVDGDPNDRREAVEGLARAYAATDEWERTIEIVEARSLLAKDDAARTAILCEAARLHESRGNSPAAALGAVCRAFALSPRDEAIEREVLRLARDTNAWTEVVFAYRRGIDRLGEADPARTAQLRLQLGSILETHTHDLPAALEAYLPVFEEHGGSLEAAEPVARVAATIGRFDVVANTLVQSARARGRLELALVTAVEEVVPPGEAWDGATDAFAVAIARASKETPAPLSRELQTQLALWHRDRRNDPDAAELALVRAVEQDASDPEALRMLAVLQRRTPSRALLDTLLRLADATQDDLGVLYEAAQVSLELLQDRALGVTILGRLLANAAEKWKRVQSLPTLPPASVPGNTRGDLSAESLSTWALEKLVALQIETGSHEAAVDTLVERSRLPFDRETSRSMRRRAAEIAAASLPDPSRAIALQRELLDEEPSDAAAIAALVDLYRAGGHLRELVDLRRHELELTQATDVRSAIRLDLANVLGALGDHDAEVEALLTNLEESAGDDATVAALTASLEKAGEYPRLANVLSEQALRLELAGEARRAADLWSRVATIAEAHLDDVGRAIDGHRRVVALDPRLPSLDALARLHARRGERDHAIEWLEQRLAQTPVDERAPVVVRLARAHLDGGDRARAMSTLEAALADDPRANEVRDLLATIHRDTEAWQSLAKVLREGTIHAVDDRTRLAYVREAAELHFRRLGEAKTAIPLLEEAARLAPQDRTVRTTLAEALRVDGRLDEARAMLEALVEEYGRRRPPERAQVHVQLAQIAEAKGDLNEALSQLELASSMDQGGASTLQMLGAVAMRAGDLARAERAYRALLLLVRRKANGGPGAAEILFELHRIATALEQPERARETLESAFEAASQSESDAIRFVAALRAQGDRELLLRALQARLPTARDPSTVADVLGEISTISEALGRVDDAVDAAFRGLEQTPSSGALHDATRAIAARNGRSERYASFLEGLVERATATGDEAQIAPLLLRLGDVLEHDVSDPKRAVAAFERAERATDRPILAWRALDRLYGMLGDVAGQSRVLRTIVQSDDEEAAAKTEAIYRLAAILLASNDTRDEGVDLLGWGIDRDPQLDRAALMLRRVKEGSVKLHALYERVARAIGDPAMLLDALERRITATFKEEPAVEMFREAVDLATKAGDMDRVEALLQRAIERARARDAVIDATWALIAYAERKKSLEEWSAAIDALDSVAEVVDPAEGAAYGIEAAQLAATKLEDLPRAARLYEKLRARDPGDRNVWQPLLELHRKLGDRERLATLIAQTVESVFDPSERNVLRVERARLLLDDFGREDDAIQSLREILDEDPEHKEAVALLLDTYEKQGRNDDLADLLSRQLDAARSRHDVDAVTSLSLRLGALLEGNRREEAMDVYRSASHLAPTNRDILSALVRLYKPSDDANDRADAMERLLAIEHGDRAASLALDLVKVRESLQDDDGVVRALDRGFREAPHNEKLRGRLEKFYGDRGDWGKLAEVIAFDAAARKDKKAAVSRFREAAKIWQEKLSDANAAAAALKNARAIAPEDVALLVDLARTQAAANDVAGAIAEIGGVLEEQRVLDSARVQLLRLRAEMRLAVDDEAKAIEDLEAAYGSAPQLVADDLATALERRRTRARDRRDLQTERAATLRSIEVLRDNKQGDRASALLMEWVARAPDDRDALRLLAEMDSAAQRWDGVIEAYRRLVAIETGDAQIDAAVRLARAAESAGDPARAREGLELAFNASPGSAVIRNELRTIYAAAGDPRELAKMALADAEAATTDQEKFERSLEAGDLLLNQAGESMPAVKPLEEAVRLKPGHHDATLLLADAYTLNGMTEEAMNLLNPAIAAHKGRRSREVAALMHRMARAANAAGGHDVELQWLAKALDADMQNGQVAAELAEVAMELQQYDFALKALKAVTLLKTPGPMSKAVANLRQAQIAHLQGDAKRAAVLAKTALAQDPKLTEAADFLRKIGS